MSYEGNMLEKYAMPSRQSVEKALLETLFRHNGVVKEFSSGEEIVAEIGDMFSLTDEQRIAVLERVYRKENRVVKTPLWHRLLFRAADSLAKQGLVTKPTTTTKLTSKREWMLTEKGYDAALHQLTISEDKKFTLPVKSYEVQQCIKKIIEAERPVDYCPVNSMKKTKTVTTKANIRSRSFRQAVIESYGYKCSVCGLMILSPDLKCWEVEAAHIVPHGLNGKDDIWNGIALCHFHHWAFDVGWFSLTNDYRIEMSSKIDELPSNHGKIDSYDFFRQNLIQNKTILLPNNKQLFPHEKSLEWHRKYVFLP